MRIVVSVIIIALALSSLHVAAQSDSLKKYNDKVVLLDTMKQKHDSLSRMLAKSDSIIRKHHDPKKATIRSAILPGLGQAYNHEYWKIPIVYGALAVPASLFVYNHTWYNRTKDAYSILVNGGDTASIYPQLKNLTPDRLQYFRNAFRKNEDYSVLYFLLAWALNVVDATVFAQLKEFDVTPDLSMQVKPLYQLNTKLSGLSFVFNYKASPKKILPSAY